MLHKNEMVGLSHGLITHGHYHKSSCFIPVLGERHRSFIRVAFIILPTNRVFCID